MKLSPEVNLLAFAHYIQASNISASRFRRLPSSVPRAAHSNLTVGGVSNAINLDSLATSTWIAW